VGAPACDKHPKDAKEINYDSIVSMLKQLSPQQYVIFPNTNSGYGQVPDGICTEETPLNAISLYGKLKDEIENIVLAHGNSTVYRLATVFGYSYRQRIDLLINTLVYEAVFNGKVQLFDGHYRRNYVHVADIARAFTWSIFNRKNLAGEVYNLGNDKINTTKEKLVELIREHIPFEIEVVNKTDPDKRDYLVSSKKLHNAGFVAGLGLHHGIKEMVNFYKYLPKSENERILLLRYMRNIN
jgi:nucleoside-diphosphate-sugar epimerase